MNIPKNHPRHDSLMMRHKIEEGVEKGITTPTGMIAHGRGEAFDYLLGEKTSAYAKKAIRAATALLLLARHPVISVNGNVAMLCPKEIISLSRELGAPIEANIFYPPLKRRALIARHLKKFGAKKVLGVKPNKRIPGLDSERGNVDGEGIWKADVVLVMLEDGDRAGALRKNGKMVVAIDLNPKSRTAKKANISIIDNVVRAVPLMQKEAGKLSGKSRGELNGMVKGFGNRKNLAGAIKLIKAKV